jgi:hypothetical protein
MISRGPVGRLEEPLIGRKKRARIGRASVGCVVPGRFLLFGGDLMGRSEPHGHHAGAVRPFSQASR